MIETKLTDLSVAFKEALASFEGFRRLGFKSDDIYVVFADGMLLISLRAQGAEFNIELGEISVKQDEFPELWAQIVERYNLGPIEEVIAIWDASYLKKHFEQVAVMIRQKGILLPSLTN